MSEAWQWSWTGARTLAVHSETQHIASLYCGDEPSSSDDLSKTAALIAAAPQMLAALRAADAHFRGTWSENGTDHQQIQSAIQAAEQANLTMAASARSIADACRLLPVPEKQET